MTFAALLTDVHARSAGGMRPLASETAAAVLLDRAGVTPADVLVGRVIVYAEGDDVRDAVRLLAYRVWRDQYAPATHLEAEIERDRFCINPERRMPGYGPVLGDRFDEFLKTRGILVHPGDHMQLTRDCAKAGVSAKETLLRYAMGDFSKAKDVDQYPEYVPAQAAPSQAEPPRRSREPRSCGRSVPNLPHDRFSSPIRWRSTPVTSCPGTGALHHIRGFGRSPKPKVTAWRRATLI